MYVPYELTSDLEYAFSKVKTDEPVFLDAETCGFYKTIRLLQIYQPHMEAVIMVEWPQPIMVATHCIGLHTIWHNSHYDLTTIAEQVNAPIIPEKFDDTFLLARLRYPAKDKFDLASVFTYVLGYDPYNRQDLDKKELQKSNWDTKTLSKDQLLYAATDVYYMPEVWIHVATLVTNQNYKLDMLTLRYCLDFQWNGMPVDGTKLLALHKKNQDEIDSYKMPVNVNSWQQVRPYIGEEESDGLALAKFALEGNIRAKHVRIVRKLKKQNSFLNKFENDYNRIYGKFMPTTRSGRLSSKDQNLQQIPRLTKGVFGYKPRDNRVLVYADYAQLELRTICAIVHCIAMERLFRAGTDLHGYTAEMIFGTNNWTKDQRNLAKTYNFNFLLVA